MIDRERSAINAFDVVRKICLNHWDVLSLYAPFVVAYGVFDVMHTELYNQLVKQRVNPGGYTMEKRARRQVVEKDASLLSNALFLYAKKEGLQELAMKVKYAPSALKLANEKELVGISSQLTNDANAHLGGLAFYGIDALWLASFVSKTNYFLDFAGTPASVREDRKKATAEIKRLVAEIRRHLRENMDVLLQNFRDSQPLIYGEYKHGRKIVETGSRTPALKGKVTDTEGKPLKGLQVLIAGTQRKSITTALGNFKFISLKPGKKTLIVKEGKNEVGKKVVEVPCEEVLIVVKLQES